MSGTIISLWLLILPVLILVEPVLGPMAYYLLVWMHPEQQMYGMAINIRWTMLIAIISLLGYLTLGKRREFPRNGMVFFLIFLAIWYVASAQINGLKGQPFSLATDFVKVVLMCIITACIINTRVRLHALIWIIVIAIGSLSLRSGLIVALTGGGGTAVYGPSFIGGTNEYARVIIYTLPLIYYLSLHSAHLYVRWGFRIVALISVLALMGTNSRGGFVGFAAMCAVAWLYASKKALTLILALVLAGGAYLVIPEQRQESFTSRAGTIENAETDSSFNSRVEAWKFGWAYTLENPFFGGGPGVYERIHLLASHNSFFEVLGESGFVGLSIYLLISVLAFKTIFNIRRMARNIVDLKWANDLAYLIMLSLVGYFAGGITKNHGFFEYYYMLLGILMGTEIAVRKYLLSAKQAAQENKRQKEAATLEEEAAAAS